MTTYRDADYATADELKAFVGITDDLDDVQLGLALTSASRAIDRACGRAFGVDSTAADRTYRVRDNVVTVDDISSTTGLSVTFTQSEEWGASLATLTLDTDFRLLPLNAAADARPWTHIELNRSLYCGRFGVLKVTAKFGWTAVPDTIKQAVLLQASRFLKRRDAPFGVTGSPDMGGELRLLDKVDPDVAVMLQEYKRRWAAV